MDIVEIAKAAYEAYCDALPSAWFQGETRQGWYDLPPSIQQAWVAACTTARRFGS